MRKIAPVLFVALLVLAGTGCSSKSPAKVVTVKPGASTTTVTTVSGESTTSGQSVSERGSTVFVRFPTGADVPTELSQMISVNKTPTLLFFYDSSQYTSQEVRKIIDSVRSANQGLVQLVAFDIGQYTTVAPDGTVDVNAQIGGSEAAKQAVLLARNSAINVTTTPFIVLTDSQGYIIYRHAGLVDPTLLEREVLRASR